MKQSVVCFECGTKFVCTKVNTKVVGPIVEVTCPCCHKKVQRNMSAFLFEQTNDLPDVACLSRARKMILMAEIIGKTTNDDYMFIRKKK